METQNTEVRRPLALWVIVGVYSSLVLAHPAIMIYLRFWSSHRFRLEARYPDWTLLDYAASYYPGVFVLLGCLGLVMLRRWAVYVFALLLVLRLWELALVVFGDDTSDTPAIIVWLSPVVALVLTAFAFFYALYLSRKGTLASGAC